MIWGELCGVAAPKQQVGQQLQRRQPALHARGRHAAAQLRACIVIPSSLRLPKPEINLDLYLNQKP